MAILIERVWRDRPDNDHLETFPPEGKNEVKQELRNQNGRGHRRTRVSRFHHSSYETEMLLSIPIAMASGRNTSICNNIPCGPGVSAAGSPGLRLLCFPLPYVVWWGYRGTRRIAQRLINIGSENESSPWMIAGTTHEIGVAAIPLRQVTHDGDMSWQLRSGVGLPPSGFMFICAWQTKGSRLEYTECCLIQYISSGDLNFRVQSSNDTTWDGKSLSKMRTLNTPDWGSVTQFALNRALFRAGVMTLRATS